MREYLADECAAAIIAGGRTDLGRHKEGTRMKKRALQVSLDVREPSVVELTVGEKVQLDRLTPSAHGYVAERHGRLLEPGVAMLSLEPGFYFFKTLSDANLKVVCGGVSTGASTNDKDDWPDPPAVATPPPPPLPRSGGDDAFGETPRFTVE
jgi:hypothetical protein